MRELDSPLEPVTLDHRTTRTKDAKAAERQQQQAAKSGAVAGEGAATEGGAAEGAVKEEGGEAAAVKEEGDGAAPMDAEAPADQAAVKEEQPEVKQEEGQPAAAAAVKDEPAEVKAEPAAEVKAEGGETAAAGAGKTEGEGGQKTGYWKRRREAEQEALYGELPEWGPAIRGGAANRGKVRWGMWNVQS